MLNANKLLGVALSIKDSFTLPMDSYLIFMGQNRTDAARWDITTAVAENYLCFIAHE